MSTMFDNNNFTLDNIVNDASDNKIEIIIRTYEESELNSLEHINDIQLKNILILELCELDNTFKIVPIERFIKKIQVTNNKNSKKYKTDICNTILFGPLKINIDSSEVFKNGFNANLSTLEYRLLLFFIDNKDKILTNTQIINCVWGIAYANTGMLRVAIRRLRSKIDPNSQYLKTIRGKGYILSNQFKEKEDKHCLIL